MNPLENKVLKQNLVTCSGNFENSVTCSGNFDLNPSGSNANGCNDGVALPEKNIHFYWKYLVKLY